ncbi:histone deacetylase [bacterium]|nr:histone deacetylase [bacterium]
MIVVHADPIFLEHDTGEGHPEKPDRARVIAAALSEHAAVSRVERATVKAREEDLGLVHDLAYVRALDLAARAGEPLDPDTTLSRRSFDVALKAAGAVVRACDEAISPRGDDAKLRSFCVVRPPGHHARPARAMGFCLLNNVAVAAASALERGKIARAAVVDFDVHHGNGTQEIFWKDPRVLYVSLHRYPFYPGTGAQDETGEGKGKGTTANFPLRAGCGGARYREAFSRALEVVSRFSPDLVIASAGFDAYAKDPIGGLGLDEDDYRWIGAELRRVADDRCCGRLVSALEGGYAIEALPGLVTAYVEGVDSGKCT